MELNNEIKVNVKVGLSVDEETFRTCMNLLKLYFQSHCENSKGIVMKFDDTIGSEPLISIVDTDAEMDRIWLGYVPESEG